MNATGENVPTGTQLFDWFVRKVKLVYLFPRVAIGYEASAGAAALVVVGKVNPWHASESYADFATSIQKELSSYFQTGDAEATRQQWYMHNSSQLLAVEAQLNTTEVVVHFMKCTLRFENRHATRDYHIYYRTFYPEEDKAFDLKHLVVPNANTAIDNGVELWNLLESYPGMKKITVGSNTTNGLPNIGYVDLNVNVDRVASSFLSMRREGADPDGANTEWLLPHAFPDSIAHDLTTTQYDTSPMVYFWVIDQDYDIPSAGSSSLFVEGRMIKIATVWRDKQNSKTVQTDVQWDLKT